jgi:hypothetical protein
LEEFYVFPFIIIFPSFTKILKKSKRHFAVLLKRFSKGLKRINIFKNYLKNQKKRMVEEERKGIKPRKSQSGYNNSLKAQPLTKMGSLYLFYCAFPYFFYLNAIFFIMDI